MNTSRRRNVQAVVLAIVVLLAGLPAALALKVPDTPGRFDSKTIPDPSIVVSPDIRGVAEIQGPLSVGDGWTSFKLANGEAWDVYLDTRSGAPTLVQGVGIPFIPGAGNALQSAAPVTLESLAASLRGFAAKNAGLLLADDKELVLNTAASGQLTSDLWKVVFNRVVSGVPVAGDRYVFLIGHGNLISFGAARWCAVTTDAVPIVPANEAFGILANHMGLTGAETIDIVDAGTLTFVPMAAAGTAVDSFDGAVGTGYQTALAWRVSLRVDGEAPTWVALIDAHTGAVLALNDETQYGQARGGIFPLTDDGIAPDGLEAANYPMPWANITIGATNSASASMGYFSCTPGGSIATTTLQGTYIAVADVCGAISKSVTCDADLDMGSSPGTDCTTPGSGGAGNTHAARSSFYHLNRIKEHARAWLPANTWLQGQMTDNVNINATCNAFWDDGGAAGTVNFYRSGGGCRNTGEIASVFLHEWGHGLDQNDGGGYDNPSEAYADITSFLLTHKSCIGRGFFSSNCSGYGNACTSCTGVRDQDWNQHATHVAQTADNWSQVGSCPSGSGPCGKEVHCEAYVAGEVLWDLAVRDLTAAGIDQQTAWQILDRLWYVSRTGSGGNAYSCALPATSRSCGATTWMQELRAADDDDGNLANGTPHAAAIFAAFNRHNIQCGAATDATNLSTTSCPSLAAPTLTATGSANTIALSWTAVPNASSYNVLRNDQSCSWGHTIIANVAGTTYTDTNLSNYFPLYYTVQAVGANTACTGTLATCITAQAIGPCGFAPTFAGVATVTNPGASTCTLNLGWTAGASSCGSSLTYNIYRSTTPGFTPGAGNRIATGVSGTSYTDAVGVSYGATYYYIVRAVDVSNGVEETNTNQQSGAPTGALTGWTDTFEGSQSGGGFDLTGWTHFIVSGATNWAWSTAQKHDGTHSWFAAEVTTTSDKVLVSPPVSVVAGTFLSFYHTYAFEGSTSSCYDAGTLEYTTNGGVTWTVVPDADFTGGGFNGTVYSLDTNPIKGKRAWCGGSIGTMTPVSVNLGGDPNLVNRTVQVRWHEGDDTGTKATGWYVDTVSVQTGASCTTGVLCTAPGAPTLTGAAGDCAGVNLTWTAGTGTTGSYNVYRAATTGGPYTKLNGLAVMGTAYSDTTAVAGTPYFYVVKGACDSAGVNESGYSGELSAARLTTGTTCNDGNACTQTDTCQGGACVGSNQVVCTASDQCHSAGTCNPLDGQCSNPAQPNGTACDDGNPCTAPDTCQSGACVSGGPVTGPAETHALAVAGGGDLTWSAVAGALGYDVVRGTVSRLFPGGAFTAATDFCVANNVTGPPVSSLHLPAAGDADWFLVRAFNTCGNGTYDEGSPSQVGSRDAGIAGSPNACP